MSFDRMPADRELLVDAYRRQFTEPRPPIVLPIAELLRNGAVRLGRQIGRVLNSQGSEAQTEIVEAPTLEADR